MKKFLQYFIKNYKSKIDQVIEQELDKRLEEVGVISPHLVPILEAMKELSVGGKRLRGMLVILGYELARGEVNAEVIKAAAAMEIFHLGLLIQDDFMDKDLVRRGVPTIVARYEDRHVGNFVSMLAGDYTFGWSIELLSKLELPADKVNKAMAIWGKYFTRVGYGQTLDGLAIADEATVLKILAMKSGEYSCVLPLVLGATLGDANAELCNKLEEYGMELGWVFQLRDDWLSEYGDSSKTGKPVGNDKREGKHSYAIMNGREKTETMIKEHMTKAKNVAVNLQGQSSQVDLMCSLVEWVGMRES